jgi:hypothetical protein
MEARTGSATRSTQLAAWALLFRSPFRIYETKPTSWIGGLPCAPAGFKWPRNAEGRHVHFVAQIDLSSLKPEFSDGASAPGLPDKGALLVFAGEDFAVRVLEASQMAQAAPVVPPDDLRDLREIGFFSSGKTFNAWAVDPMPYVSRCGEDADIVPDPFLSPKDWITNWAIAGLEAEILLKAITVELRRDRGFVEARKKSLAEGRTLPTPKHVEQRLEQFAATEKPSSDLISALEAWRDLANSQTHDVSVDRNALEEIFEKRMALHDRMKRNYGSKHLLPGNAEIVWKEIVGRLPKIDGHPDFSRMSAAYRPFAEKQITGWRGHRLFGLEPEFLNNQEDLRGQDPLISIASDKLLGTESEHDYGFSIWLDREKMAAGKFEQGQFVRHCAV